MSTLHYRLLAGAVLLLNRSVLVQSRCEGVQGEEH